MISIGYRSTGDLAFRLLWLRPGLDRRGALIVQVVDSPDSLPAGDDTHL